MAKYRILCFDGGGIKGAFSLKLYQMILKEHPDLLNNVDLLAGTSTGGIISIALAAGVDDSLILDLYRNKGSEIFKPYKKRLFHKDGLNQPLYTNKGLKKELENILKDSPKMTDLKKRVFVNTFKLDLNENWEPIQVSNFPGTSYINSNPVDSALMTSAAPVFFPSYMGCIDGGVFANNPASVALSMALDPKLAGAKLEDISILSIGCGFNNQYIDQPKEDWGALQWLNPKGTPKTPLLEILMGGVQELDSYQCNHILGDRFLRLNPKVDKAYGLDDWKDVDKMIKDAEDFPANDPVAWESTLKFVKDNF